MMEIILRPAAVTQLKNKQLQSNEGIRINASFIGSCSIYAEYDLSISQKRDMDDLFVVEDIPIIISKESQKYLAQRISLDYNPSLGYKLSSNEETYRYNLKLKHE